MLERCKRNNYLFAFIKSVWRWTFYTRTVSDIQQHQHSLSIPSSPFFLFFCSTIRLLVCEFEFVFYLLGNIREVGQINHAFGNHAKTHAVEVCCRSVLMLPNFRLICSSLLPIPILSVSSFSESCLICHRYWHTHSNNRITEFSW